MTLQTAYAVTYGAEPTPTVLAGLTGLNTGLNPEVDNEVKIGSPYPQFAVVRAQKPRMVFSTNAVAPTLDVVGYSGANIDATNLLKGYYAAMSNGLVNPAGTHQVYTADRGVLFGRRLSCQNQQDALLDLDALLYSADGAAHPISIGTGTLPTLARDNIRHTLSSTSIAGIDMGCVTSVDIDFGNSLLSRGCNSAIYDQHLEQPGIQTVITIVGLDAEKFGASGIPPDGKGGTKADTTIYLRKRDLSGIGFVAGATAEHIKIDAEGVAVVLNHDGQGTTSSELTVQFTCQLDASGNAPLAISTTSALP